MLQSLDVCGETWAIALDISKSFDKVWHAGLIYNYGVSGHALDIISSFFLIGKLRQCLMVIQLLSYQSRNSLGHLWSNFVLDLH